MKKLRGSHFQVCSIFWGGFYLETDAEKVSSFGTCLSLVFIILKDAAAQGLRLKINSRLPDFAMSAGEMEISLLLL